VVLIDRHQRKQSERFRYFPCDELIARDKTNLDLFWLRDDSLKNLDDLPPPDVLQQEIIDHLEAALPGSKGEYVSSGKAGGALNHGVRKIIKAGGYIMKEIIGINHIGIRVTGLERYTHIALDVRDIQAVQKQVESLGIKITEGPVTLANGGVMFFVRDQDRNVIEFHQNA